MRLPWPPFLYLLVTSFGNPRVARSCQQGAASVRRVGASYRQPLHADVRRDVLSRRELSPKSVMPKRRMYAAHHLHVDRASAFTAPALERSLGDLPAFIQLGLGQVIVFSQDDSLVDAAKLQYLRIRPFVAADRDRPQPTGQNISREDIQRVAQLQNPPDGARKCLGLCCYQA